MKSNNKDIEVIINILKLMKNPDEDANDFKIDPGGLKYLLGQILRQLQIPQEKLYLSYRARLLWNEIRSSSKDSTFDYYYQKRVIHENETPIKVLTYKGASSTPVERLLKKDEWFRLRQVFHDDHVIPMKLIVERLVQLKEPNYENVMDILKNISVCRMLKSEDRKIRE